MTSGTSPRFIIETVCCKASTYRNGKLTFCVDCKKRANYRKHPINGLMKQKHEDKKIADFPAYKPVLGLSLSDRTAEAIKRRQFITEYESIKPTDTTEIKFIKQRIKWNNERIALLLG